MATKTDDVFVSDNGITRKATEAEIESLRSWQTPDVSRDAIFEAEDAARASARAKLAALGLTETEVAAIIGG